MPEEQQDNTPVEPTEETMTDEQSQHQTDRDRSSRFLETVGLFFLELIKIVVLAGITVGIVRYFVFKPFTVQGQSMESTFFEREYLIIDELSYRFREPERGDVIVLRAPTQPGDFYLKRIVGLPGERLSITNNSIVIYNDAHPQGVVIEEQYLDPGTETTDVRSVTLADDEFYVLGDNRDESYDSRRFGPIDRDAIVGRAWFRGYPLSRVGIFQAPDYNL